MNPHDVWKWFGKEAPATASTPPPPAPPSPPAPFTAGQASGGFIPFSSITTASAYIQSMNAHTTQFAYISTPASDPKFSGKDFAAGSARGARSFRVDDLGRLTGIHYKQIWTPGENHAECKADPKHTEGKYPDCRCGFYGYYDGSNDYYSSGYISAVIEGYGEAVMGDKGFRVMKARILALSIDETVTAKGAHLARRNYSEIPIFDSFRQMLAEFPTDYELDSPSPDEDGFWTRKA